MLILNNSGKCPGRFVEWHVDLGKSFQHFTFDLVSGFHHSIVFLLSSFSLAWFKAIWPICDTMCCDGIEQLFVEIKSFFAVTLSVHSDQRLKGLECLNGTLETDCAGFKLMRVGGLCNDRADQIVRENVRPGLLPTNLRPRNRVC